MTLLTREPVDTFNKLWEDEAEGVLYGWPIGLGSSDCRYRGALGSTLAIETRISGLESRLGERIAHLEASSAGLSSRLSRIENVLDQFLVRTGRGEQ